MQLFPLQHDNDQIPVSISDIQEHGILMNKVNDSSMELDKKHLLYA